MFSVLRDLSTLLIGYGHITRELDTFLSNSILTYALHLKCHIDPSVLPFSSPGPRFACLSPQWSSRTVSHCLLAAWSSLAAAPRSRVCIRLWFEWVPVGGKWFKEIGIHGIFIRCLENSKRSPFTTCLDWSTVWILTI